MPATNLQELLDQRTTFLRFLEKRVGDRAFAEDILQAAYMRTVEAGIKPDAASAPESAVGWFYTVLRHAVIDHYRHRASESAGRERWLREFGNEEPTAPDPDARTFVCGCIEAVLPSLRPAYAEILREVELEEMPLSDYAKRHGLTPGNAAVRAHRARAALRRELLRACGLCAIQACLDCDCPAVCETS